MSLNYIILSSPLLQGNHLPEQKRARVSGLWGVINKKETFLAVAVYTCDLVSESSVYTGILVYYLKFNNKILKKLYCQLCFMDCSKACLFASAPHTDVKIDL